MLGKLLVFGPLFNIQRMHVLKKTVNCAGHYGNYLAVSVFFNVHIVSKSPAEFSTPICIVLELRSCLVNLALGVKWLLGAKQKLHRYSITLDTYIENELFFLGHVFVLPRAHVSQDNTGNPLENRCMILLQGFLSTSWTFCCINW